jgi:hypothetical protein
MSFLVHRKMAVLYLRVARPTARGKAQAGEDVANIE